MFRPSFTACVRLERAFFVVRRFTRFLSVGLCLVIRASATDSVVVFNEINYHPPNDESAQEWLELHNQMAIDIDLSAWSISGGIAFTFTEGTLIPAGGYLVVAHDPATLQSATGIANVVGPFSGRLNNSGDDLQLRDRNQRLMDEVEYGDQGNWPLAADGSGATLAKRDPDGTSDPPENWASSVVAQGTPGARNFPQPARVLRTSLIALDSLWRYDASGMDLGAGWRQSGFDDSAWAGRNRATLVGYWPFDGDATAWRGANGSQIGGVAVAADRHGTNGALAFVGGLQQYVSVPGGGGLNGASAGAISLWVRWSGAQDADCCGSFGAVLARQANGQFSDDILALNNADPATARVVWRQSGGPAPVLLTGTTAIGTNWHHVAVTFSPGGSALYVDGVPEATATGAGLNNNPAIALSIGAWAGDGSGFATGTIDDVAVWDQPLSMAQIVQLAAGTRVPLDFTQPESAVYYTGDGRLQNNDDLRQTELPLGPVTYYFRNSFVFDGDPAGTALTLDLAVDDGAVLYLNGTEVYRHNMPSGSVTYTTAASTETADAPLLTGLELSAGSLVAGTNTLAVEVHQAAVNDLGMVFGAALTAALQTPSDHVARRPAGLHAASAARMLSPGAKRFNPGSLVFNEVTGAGATPFQVELINRGTEPIEAGGYEIARTGVSSDAARTLPAQSISPGAFLTLDADMLGFGAAAGDKFFLLLPDRSGVADAIMVRAAARARFPDGSGEWLAPSALTPGSSNAVTVHDEVVINEIFYHGPPVFGAPAVIGTNVVISLTNRWRYDESGLDPGMTWREPDYDDSGWAEGAGLFYVTENNLPAAKNTGLTLGPTTYYFRTAFVYTGTPVIHALTLRHVVDDGASMYLNGTEVHRFNLHGGPVSATNTAVTPVLNATFRTPVTVSVTNLVLGTNVLAVEVHQAADARDDVVFGAELTATIDAVPATPFQHSPEQWVELYNQSGQPVDLAGWRLDGSIEYGFPSNTTIQAGDYLVVAKDPNALAAKFPGIRIAGPFTNSLSHRGELLGLKDAADNPADAVHYYDDGRWPRAADSGGASLELRDPRADNAAAEAWAASDETVRTAWRTYSYRGTSSASPVGPDGQWHEFVMGLLDRGEVLLDDISVIENPDGARLELIQNGGFDDGTNHWRILGNHQGEVIDDPAQPGNKVLRLVASGGTEHMSNHAETTLNGNRDVANGRSYLISFRARWVSGSPQFNTRLYFNRLARTTILDVPVPHGTPGRQNSTFTTNLGPTYGQLRHDPPVPPPLSPVTISVAAADPDGVADLRLWSRVDGGDWSDVPMTVSSDGRYEAVLPGQPAAKVVQFYVEGTDALGAASMFPAAGPDSRALYQVDDGLAAMNGLHNFRIVTLKVDADSLFRTVNLMSNGRLGCTVIYDEHEIFYDVGLRLKGSEHSRTTTPRLGFNVAFNSDQLFRGVHSTVAIDRSESTGFGQREMLIHQTLNHAGGVPTKYHDLVQVLAPRPAYTGSAELQLARYGDVFLDDQFDHGGDGTVFEYELIYQLNSTDNGSPEGYKVPAPDSVVGTAIRDLGNTPEDYRWSFLIKNNEDRDDYSGIMRFAKTMGSSGAAFYGTIGDVIDVDQWLRGVAVNALSGVGDSYGGDGAQHNVQFYVRPGDGKVLYFPHDMDAFFNATRPIVPNNDVAKLIAVPGNARAYYGHLLDIIATTYNADYLGHWASQFGRLLPAQDFAGHLAFITQRANFVSSRVRSAVPNVSFAITSNGGNDLATTNSSITLTGTAPLGVKDIQVNGVIFPPDWTSTTAWSLRYPLLSGLNSLNVQGLDLHGAVVSNAGDSISITNLGSGMPDAIVARVSLEQGAVELTWNSVPGQVFQVEFKDDLGAPAWSPLGGERSATASMVTVTDPLAAGSSRFYRVRLVE